MKLIGAPILIGSLMLPVVLLFAGDETMPWPPEFVHAKIATTLGGWHSTTRGTIRLVFGHEGKWLVFRGDPNAYHFSKDGRTWTSTQAPQASRSHLIRGNTIYTFYTVMRKGEPDWIFDHFVATGSIAGKTITWAKPVKVDTKLGYYNDLQVDTAGRFTMTGRSVTLSDEREVLSSRVLWKRTTKPGDFLHWGPDIPCINHSGDKHGKDWWRKVGSTVHENVALEGGKSYVFGMMTVDGVGKLYGNLHDGQSWGRKDAELATGMCTWAGTDRRMCAIFDRSAKILHLAYVNAIGRLFYPCARPPYRAKDWSQPVQLQAKTFCTVLSLDTSHTPAHVYCLFGRTRRQERDRRNTYGELHLQRLDGKAWSEPVLVSEPGTQDNWYPNMNEDVRTGMGVLYLKGAPGARKGSKPSLDIMFASTGCARNVRPK